MRCGFRLVAALTLFALPISETLAVEPSGCTLPLMDPAAPVDRGWDRHDFVGHSAFRNATIDGVPVIEASPDGASGIYAPVHADVRAFPLVRWRWRVDQLQPSADLRRTQTEDFSGVIFFGFGEPDLLHPQVPTLAYAWTATPVPNGTFIRNPRHPDSLVIIKLEGAESVGQWRDETRNLEADYRAAFGHAPEHPLRFVALLSDDDQTGEPSRAAYAAITLFGCLGKH